MSLLARLRVLCLGFALATVVQLIPMLISGTGSPVARAGAIVLALGLGGYWIWGSRRTDFPRAAEPAETLTVFLLLSVASGNPLLPLCGLAFHSLYGSSARSWARYGLWMAALLAAHASRGVAQLDGDLVRVLAISMVPALFKVIRSATEGLERNERRFASLIQRSTDIVTVVGEDRRIRWQADSIRAVLGIDPAALVGTALMDLIHPDDRSELEGYFARAGQQTGLTSTLALRMRAHDGRVRRFEVVIADRLNDPSVGGYVLNMRDATDRLLLEDELRALVELRERDSLNDPLTGLPNRRSLFTCLDNIIERAQFERTRLALLLIDLDRFKELNDTLGHHVGDQLLREIGPRLRDASCDLEVVARLGGDEFAIVVALDGDISPEHVATMLRAAIERPFVFQGLSLLVEASVGIALYPDHARDAESLLRRADIAMYTAKRHQSGHALYNADADDHSRERLALLGELPDALASDQLVVHYQPKFDLRTDDICGVEALVRWQHPRLGLLYPGEFLSLAEQTGLMRPLTLRVLDESLKQCAKWRAQGISLPVAVNLSAPNLLDAALPGDVDEMLERWEVDPSYLQLEITERIIGTDPVRLRGILAQLRDRGIWLSLDDFGTGSSSLSYLRRLPVQELKIDKSFVLAMGEDDHRDAAVVRTIIALAGDLGLRSVAEGIETEADCELLRTWGCDHGQGYQLARPMTGEAVSELVCADPAGPER